jgi:hypothetical protein
MTDAIPPKWVVLRRVNGHCEPVAGPVIEMHESEEAARTSADFLSNKHHGIKFSTFRLIMTMTVVPTPVIETVEEQGD